VKDLDELDRTVFLNNQEITEEVILYYEKNPGELDLIINKEHFNAVYLAVFFIIGLVITVVARVVSYYYGNTLGEFVNSVVLDVVSELGIAIFGGAVVAYLIENLNKQQFQKNVKFRQEVKRIIDQRRQNKQQ